MKIEKFDRAVCRALRERMNAVLAEAGIEGLTFEVGNMSFTNTECQIKVTAATAGAEKARAGRAEMIGKLYGLACTEKDGYKLVDFHAKKRKFPFIVEHGGKTYKMSPDRAK